MPVGVMAVATAGDGSERLVIEFEEAFPGNLPMRPGVRLLELGQQVERSGWKGRRHGKIAAVNDVRYSGTHLGRQFRDDGEPSEWHRQPHSRDHFFHVGQARRIGR